MARFALVDVGENEMYDFLSSSVFSSFRFDLENVVSSYQAKTETNMEERKSVTENRRLADVTQVDLLLVARCLGPEKLRTMRRAKKYSRTDGARMSLDVLFKKAFYLV